MEPLGECMPRPHKPLAILIISDTVRMLFVVVDGQEQRANIRSCGN